MSRLCSFVIPCYNEEGNVEAVYRAIHDTFDPEGIPCEIVMVNDGSSDDTLNKLKDLYNKTEDRGLVVVSFSRNFGKEAAILAGMTHTTGDYVCLIDADLQQTPDVALSMYRRLEADEDLDCVAAFQQERHEGKILAFFKDAFYALINKVSDVRFMPGASDFRMCRRKMIDAILDLPEYHRFSKGIFAWVGFRSEFIPYEAKERNSGNSKWSFFKLFNYAIDGIVGYSTAPLRLSTLAGGIVFTLSCLLLLVLLILVLAGVTISSAGWIIGVILFIGGLQLIMTGIIGEYLSRTYIQGKHRPVYIEKEVLERKS
ncbi:MAG: glycosyltransferase family 2 protein [Lachnospiraceae bacterium]|nr:glycosyltransferase family 2 protein [Lachnospiraceae bacterium]